MIMTGTNLGSNSRYCHYQQVASTPIFLCQLYPHLWLFHALSRISSIPLLRLRPSASHLRPRGPCKFMLLSSSSISFSSVTWGCFISVLFKENSNNSNEGTAIRRDRCFKGPLYVITSTTSLLGQSERPPPKVPKHERRRDRLRD